MNFCFLWNPNSNPSARIAHAAAVTRPATTAMSRGDVMSISGPLMKLMNAFCSREGISTNSVRFLFDGNRVNETQTPAQLDMEDGDLIDLLGAMA